ncbi:biotin--[acetyl-CoA-carboxylase] ligase [bacterium]|nr:biotin--[acetyl-CoA-carboxylase] ligase [bacterium]
MKDMFNDINLNNVNSTNQWAKEHLTELHDRSVVTAQTQTNGRGRLNRSWMDLGEGNLFLTFVLKPDLKYSSHFSNITQYLSVILCRILEKYEVAPQIKWPNDVLVNGKKIAGILAETSMSQNNFNGIVLGIGVNLNAKAESFKSIDKPATALNLEINREINLENFKTELCEEFFGQYDEFMGNGFLFIMDEYIKHACFLNKELTVAQINKNISGTAKGINEHGELVLAQQDKDIILDIGDIL